jgi:site-specific DNA-methyltransferase (adenine-specific)/modification methylase
MLELNKIYLGDCLEVMKDINDKSIDMILCDLPYGTTACKWDIIIPFEPLWEQYKRIIKDNGVVVLTASQPFTSLLIMSNLKLYRYNLVWEKSKASNFLHARKQPLLAHEDICIFYKKQPTYNPQMTNGKPYSGEKRAGKLGSFSESNALGVPNPLFRRGSSDGKRFPRSVIYFKTAESEGKQFHPTQKPVALGEYLIKTYTNEGDAVLDNCCGSASFCLAAKNLNRQFIGIEKDKDYYEIACKRVSRA